tara:strand:+ start:634 stop:1059 length:426 start_codon:yes stop_codon:yes gene_type:complete
MKSIVLVALFAGMAYGSAQSQLDSLSAVVAAEAADSVAVLSQAVIDADSTLAELLPLDLTAESCVTDADCVVLVLGLPTDKDSTVTATLRGLVVDILRSDYRATVAGADRVRIKPAYAVDAQGRLATIFSPPADTTAPPAP